MKRTELFIYRLGLVCTVIGIGFAIAALIAVLQKNYFFGILFGLPMLFFIGFGVDFIINKSTKDLERFIVFIFDPIWSVSSSTSSFKNPDDKSSKK